MIEKCPEQSQLGKLVGGELNVAETTQVLNHLDTCLSCAELLDSLNERPSPFVTLLRGIASDIDDAVLNEPELQNVLKDLRNLPVVDCLDASKTKGDTQEPQTAVPALTPLGPWQLLEKIGQGGMGVVYRARHSRLGQERALKLLPPAFNQSPEALARFETEIRALGRLDHKHIVRAIGAEEIGAQLVLVMELVNGKDLSQLVREQGPMPVEQACDYIRQAALGLLHIDSAGLVHRDLKPRNLMRDESGCIRILDMGLARLRSCDSDLASVNSIKPDTGPCANDDSLTLPGQIMGTRGYIAPEQAANTHDVDIRADIYGLGATLYFLLTGIAPFIDQVRQPELSHLRVLQSGVVIPLGQLRPAIPHCVVALVERMMATDPDQRFQNPSEVINAIDRFTPPPTLRIKTQWATGSRFITAAVPSVLVSSLIVWKLTVGTTPAGPDLQAERLMRDDIQKPFPSAPDQERRDSAATAFTTEKSAAEFLFGLEADIYIYDEQHPNASNKRINSIDDWPGKTGRVVAFELPPFTTISPAQLAAVIDAAPLLNTVRIGFHEQILYEHVVALKRCRHLHEFILGSVRPSAVTDDDLSLLLASAPNLYAVMLQGLNTDGSCLNGIAEPDRLVSLRIGLTAPIVGEDRRPLLTPEWILSLRRFPNLRTLNLPGIALMQEHVQAMSSLPAMKCLYLNGASGVEDCLDGITALANLEELGLVSDRFGDSQLKRLHAMQGLKILEVGSSVNHAAIHRFQSAVPKCRVLGGAREFPPHTASDAP